MGIVWFVVRCEVRRRWRSWLALALLVATVAGFVEAAAAAGRRTAAAFPAYLRAYGYDSLVYSVGPLDKLGSLPEVSGVVPFGTPANGNPSCACRTPLLISEFSVLEASPADLGRLVRLTQGRLPFPDAPYEVLASYTLEKDEGLHLGSVIRVPFFSSAQQFDVLTNNLHLVPHGPTVALRIVGFEAWENDFPSVGNPGYSVFTSPAFAPLVNARTALAHLYAVRLRHGPDDLARFTRDATAQGAVGSSGQETATTVSGAIHPQAVGWWILAALLGLAGAAVVGQALNRQALAERETLETLTVLGLGRREATLIGLARALGIGVAGAVGAMGVAYALSPLAPVGEARIAEPSTGPRFDALVLGSGAVAVVAAAVVLGVWPAWRGGARKGSATARAARPSVVVGRLVAAGAPPSMVVGVRRALERGRGRASVPVGNALAGAALAVAALCGIAVFGSSLTHLTGTPHLYGQSFQIWFNNLGGGPNNGSIVSPVVDQLKRDPMVTGITLGAGTSVTINGVGTDAIAGAPVRGRLLVSTVAGRAPVSPDEVALGHRTMLQVGASVGSKVRVTVPLSRGGSRTSTFRVVGMASFPPDFGVVGLDHGAVFTLDGLVAADCAPGPGLPTCRRAARSSLYYVVLVALRGGPAGLKAAARYAHEYPSATNLPVTPANLVNFGQAVNFPLILALVVTLFGAATVVHVLVVSVARRRQELALLKTLGFVRRQVVTAVCWQASTVALVGLVIGVPVGLAVGRAVWRAFATNLGVVPFPVIPVRDVVLLGAGVLMTVNVLALGPALVSAGEHPGTALREE